MTTAVVSSASSSYTVKLYNPNVVVRDNFLVGAAFTPTFYDTVRQPVYGSGQLSNTANFSNLLETLFKTREFPNDNGGSVYWGDLVDIASQLDLIVAACATGIQELLGTQDFNSIAVSCQKTLSEVVTFLVVNKFGWNNSVAELLTTSPTVSSVMAWYNSETLKLYSNTSSVLHGNAIAAERIKLQSALLLSLLLLVSEAVTVPSNVNNIRQQLVKIANELITSGACASLYEATITVNQLLKVAYAVAAGKGASVTEVVNILGAYTLIFGASGSILDGVVALADATPALVFVLEVSDTAKIIDPAGIDGGFDPTQFLGLLLNEQVSVKIGYNADDGLWTGWVMNTQNVAVTNYSDWNFNSFATLSTVDVAASSTGLYVLGGTNDSGAPISAMAAFAKSDFGDSRLKRMPYAYIGVRTTGQLYFITETDDGIERVYSLVATASGPHTERVQMARGVASRYWQFTLENVAGADFRLDELELLPVTLSRRV